jgi:hypothetical protein
MEYFGHVGKRDSPRGGCTTMIFTLVIQGHVHWESLSYVPPYVPKRYNLWDACICVTLIEPSKPSNHPRGRGGQHVGCE